MEQTLVLVTPTELRTLIRDAVRAEIPRPSPGIKEIMNESLAASYVGKQPATLRQWRTHGKGPAYHKKGRQILYKKADLDAWLATGRKFTSETQDAPY